MVTGPTLVGHLMNWGLFGVLTVQVYIYYISFPKDHWRLKGVVFFAYILEIIQIILSTHDAFRVYGSGWGNPQELDAIGLVWVSIPILDSLISSLSQMFYSWRIYTLSRNKWLVGVILMLALVELGAGIYDGVACLHLNSLIEIPTKTYKSTIVWTGAAALDEILITCSMFYYLRKAKKDSRTKRTISLLSHLIKLSVETGFVCAAVTIGGLILFVASPTTTCYEVFAICASKLFSNCFVAVLNSRVEIVGGRNAPAAEELEWAVSTGAATRKSRTAAAERGAAGVLRSASMGAAGAGARVFGKKSVGSLSRGITVEITTRRDTDVDLLEMHSPSMGTLDGESIKG
ncbi:hypothetical protein BXZ70DRAFT_498790 [Cristinia sonorae]|uniref:DUF6534 domain-containing protein n=1 Tax=Cristinia sonorae TaxID=1940300 RepID=A0A8K0UHF2_9AGAR|nr:hypothetical protein BXZ70DRAFT_498790 [Cristinia sonorae]